jgi:two-component system LytT family response regulator
MIVDDEELARKRLRRMLAPFGDVEIIGEAETGVEAVTKIESEQPDLIFLDVQMPDLDGFGALRMIELDRTPMVIFVTAFDQFAVNAFEVNAIDYLLKPIHRQRLEQAVAKAREKASSRDQAGAQLTQFLKSFSPPTRSYLQRLPVRSQNRILSDHIAESRSRPGLRNHGGGRILDKIHSADRTRKPARPTGLPSHTPASHRQPQPRPRDQRLRQ